MVSCGDTALTARRKMSVSSDLDSDRNFVLAGMLRARLEIFERLGRKAAKQLRWANLCNIMFSSHNERERWLLSEFVDDGRCCLRETEYCQ